MIKKSRAYKVMENIWHTNILMVNVINVMQIFILICKCNKYYVDRHATIRILAIDMTNVTWTTSSVYKLLEVENVNTFKSTLNL
jgi:hypothetical protein